MNADSGVALTALKVDGGMVYNDLLMQFQADVLGVPVIRPRSPRRPRSARPTRPAWRSGSGHEVEDLRANWAKDKEWEPKMDAAQPRQGVRALEEGRHADLRLGRVVPFPS